MLVSLPALTMGYGGICIMDKVLRKYDAIYGEFGCIGLH